MELIASTSYQIGIVSDTHGTIPAQLFTLLDDVDLILHAGDIGSHEALIELEAIAPVHAVRGNTDGFDPYLPLVREVQTPAGLIILTHGHLPTAPAENHNQLLKRFAELHPFLIIFGHTHRPYHKQFQEIHFFNPGSPTRPRNSKASIGLLSVNLKKNLDNHSELKPEQSFILKHLFLD